MDLYNKATIAPILKGNITQTSKVHSTVARYQDFRNANKTLKMQGNANNTLKMSKHATKNFDIARTCP